MQSALRLSRLILPVAFFGYGAFANLSLLLGDGNELTKVEGSVIQGELSADLGQLYTREMPHRKPALAWLGAGRYLLAGEGREGVIVGRDGWLFTDEEMVAASDEDVAFMVGEALDAQARLDRIGARLVVAPLPAKLDIYRDHSADPRAAAAMQAQYERFVMALAAAGVPTVDTRPALLAAAGTQVFLTRDTHWTPAGASAVAGAIADSGLVPMGDTVFSARTGAAVMVPGDLVSFVTTEALAPEIGLGPEKIVPYVAEAADASGGIFAADTPVISTILVGTSYSADPRWSFAPALSLALGSDVLNLAEKGQGPVRPLRAMLADPTLAVSPPDTVIWEVPVRYLADPQVGPSDPAPEAAGEATVAVTDTDGDSAQRESL